MEVWIVSEISHQDEIILGVCATEELADKLIDRHRRRGNAVAVIVKVRYVVIERVDEL